MSDGTYEDADRTSLYAWQLDVVNKVLAHLKAMPDLGGSCWVDDMDVALVSSTGERFARIWWDDDQEVYRVQVLRGADTQPMTTEPDDRPNLLAQLRSSERGPWVIRVERGGPWVWWLTACRGCMEREGARLVVGPWSRAHRIAKRWARRLDSSTACSPVGVFAADPASRRSTDDRP